MNAAQSLRPFHLAIPVNDLAAARQFYGVLMACPEGRSSSEWIDFDFFGHQLVVHLDGRGHAESETLRNLVDGHGVPVPHFGVVLDMATWQDLAQRLQAAKVEFIIEPTVRFRDQPGEQATLFIRDPAGNHLEFKAFQNLQQLFAR